jgi:hypothetical protein
VYEKKEKEKLKSMILQSFLREYMFVWRLVRLHLLIRGLDACFLKGEYGGQLMAAVGKDGNNQMIPIAYAVVEAETRDSWQWFLDLLLEDLNDIQHKSYAFISDQQKVYGSFLGVFICFVM